MSYLLISILLSSLTFASSKFEDHSPLDNQLECLTELQKICAKEKDEAACLVNEESKKKLPRHCQSTNNCHAEVKKICPEKEDELLHLTCLKEKRSALSFECQRLVVPSESTLDYMKNCQKDIEKLCPEDEKLLASDPVAAAAKEDDCIKKNLLKLNAKCQEIIKKEEAIP